MRSNEADDLSTRARIRDAAIRLYGLNGFARTTLRAIATEAEVSPGLVIHHFGSTAGLRQACDDAVLATSSTRATEEITPEGTRNLIAEFTADPQTHTLELNYIRQTLLEGSGQSEAFFQRLVDVAETTIREGISAGTIRAFNDPRGMAVLTTLTSLGALAFGPMAAAVLGIQGDWHTILTRMGAPGMELYTHGFYTSDAFLRAFEEGQHDSRHQG